MENGTNDKDDENDYSMIKFLCDTQKRNMLEEVNIYAKHDLCREEKNNREKEKYLDLN